MFNKDQREELQEEIKALKAKVAAGEEAALKRVCEALNVSKEEVEKAELTGISEKPAEAIIRCFVATPVRVNMTVYHGWVDVAKSTFGVIQQAIGDRRMRLLRELTSSKYVLDELCGPAGAPRLVERLDASGERIA